MKLSLLDRILNRCVLGVTSYNNTRCWLSQAAPCNKGYPKIKVDGVARRVHRVLWELVKGRMIRAGYTLDHLCFNTFCVRPDHLEEVSRPENTATARATNVRKCEYEKQRTSG